MKVLVTGGSGFLGDYVRKELEKRAMYFLPFDTSIGLNITHDYQVNYEVERADAVIHLAGILGTSELFDNPQKAIDVNVKGTLNIITACTKYNKPCVFIQMPFTGWTNIYQATKLCSYNLAEAYRIHKDLQCSYVRAYNAYGIGQHVHGPQKFMPTFATRSWRNQPIPIWGNGSQLVDIIHASDIARMLVDALSFHNGEIFDAGTSIGISVNEIAQMILNITHSNAGIEYLPMRVGELQDGIPPVAQCEGWHLLNWHPTINYDTFEQTVYWYKEDRP